MPWLKLSPAQPTELGLVVAERDRRRWERGHLEIRTTSGPAAPPRDSPVLFGPNGLYVGGHAPVDRHPQAGVVAVNADNDRSTRSTHERVLVGTAQGDGADGERLAPRHQLNGVEGQVRVRVLPGPQVIIASGCLGGLALTRTRHLERPFPKGLEVVVLVGDGQEREEAPTGRYHLDFEALADRYRDGRPTPEVEAVVGNMAPQRLGVARGRPQLSVSEDNVAGGPTNVNADRPLAGSNAAALRALGHLEGEAPQQLGA